VTTNKFIPWEVLSVLKDLVDPQILLMSLGFEIRKVNDSLRGCCIIHGGDNKTSFSFHLPTKTWTCWSHNCHMNVRYNDVFDLVSSVNGSAFHEAVQYVADFVGFDLMNGLDDETLERIRLQREELNYVRLHQAMTGGRSRIPTVNIPDECVRYWMWNRCDYFNRPENGGFSDRVLNMFEIGQMTDKFGVPRMTIPIRDDEGRLVGVNRRRIDSDEDPRYYPLCSFPRGEILYNFHNAKKVVDNFNNSLIITEGFKSTWKLVEYGYPNTVAIMGSAITQPQKNLIFMKTIFDVILMFDGDAAGKNGVLNSKPILSEGVTVHEVEVPCKDVDLLSKDEIEDIFNKADVSYLLDSGGE